MKNESISRADKKRSTRKSIIDSSINLFLKQGVNATQVGDIVEKSNIARGTFYIHFADKEGLLEYLLHSYNTELTEGLQPLFKNIKNQSIEKTLNIMAENILDFLESNKVFVLIYADRMTSDKSINRLKDGVNPQMIDLISSFFSREANCNKHQAILLTQGLLAMWMRMALQHLFTKDLPRHEVINAVAIMTKGAVFSYLPELKDKFKN